MEEPKRFIITLYTISSTRFRMDLLDIFVLFKIPVASLSVKAKGNKLVHGREVDRDGLQYRL